MAQFHSLRIKQIIKETANAVSVTFEVPANLKDAFVFAAGQYVTIKATLNGEEVRRAYSICSSPSSGELKVAIKAVEGGLFSVYANEELAEGDILEVGAPEGRFVLSPASNETYLAVAAGSGITPVLSMIKTAIENGNSMHLIYCNKTQADTIFKNEIDALAANNNKFQIHYFFSREEVSNATHGRIDSSNLNHLLNSQLSSLSISKVFLCGPEAMIHAASDVFEANGLEKENILYELFSTPVEEVDTSHIPEGNSEIKVVLDEEEQSFMMSQKEMILTAALKEDIDAPYSCQGGICSSCLARVTEGEASMHRNEILTDSEVAEGLILTCQAHPTTPKVTIDFDDV
ncbi:ferredoxin--NADP reductase [Urechidicola sp. KH5]